MEFTVTIDQFDGPLDLMLHLIKEGNLDLFDLDIAKLTDQYLEYIHSMEQLHLDIASDYLSQLATLIEYKSKKLLPVNDANLEDEYEEDESEKLVQRLMEYARYKEVVSQFEDKYKERSMMHDKPVENITSKWEEEKEEGTTGTPYQLIKAMQKVLKRIQMSEPYEVSITTKEITMDERIQMIRKKLNSWPDHFDLNKTMEDCHSAYMVVVTFISLLEMVHEGTLNFTVQGDDVYFSKGANV